MVVDGGLTVPLEIVEIKGPPERTLWHDQSPTIVRNCSTVWIGSPTGSIEKKQVTPASW